jgi:hypothetical protein
MRPTIWLLAGLAVLMIAGFATAQTITQEDDATEEASPELGFDEGPDEGHDHKDCPRHGGRERGPPPEDAPEDEEPEDEDAF